MFGKQTIVAALMIVCSSVSVALAEGGTIKGVAKWQGKAPSRKPIQVSADPNCPKLRANAPLLSEKLVINANNTVRDVFVYVKRGLPAGKIWPVPAKPVVLDQTGCHYVPHVFGIMVDQELLILNSDTTGHNVNGQPKNNTGFNHGQPKKGMKSSETFGTREMMFKIKCDIHPWMSAYCAVMEHPFFATTDANGEFEITGLPDGEYVIATWAIRFKKSQEMPPVTIKDGETKEIEFVFKRPKKKKKD